MVGCRAAFGPSHALPSPAATLPPEEHTNQCRHTPGRRHTTDLGVLSGLCYFIDVTRAGFEDTQRQDQIMGVVSTVAASITITATKAGREKESKNAGSSDVPIQASKL